MTPALPHRIPAVLSVRSILPVLSGLGRHLLRQWRRYLCLAALFGWCYLHYRIGVNLSDSLPGHVYLIELGVLPARTGDLVAFTWQRRQFYRPERILLKEVRGVAGQQVRIAGRQVFVDDVAQGLAKPVSRRGVPLQVAEPGTIPCGHYFVATAHRDSLDSRYRITGLIGPDRIIGRAHVLF